MMRDGIVILIGNGLGMALDSDYFRLERGLRAAFQKLDEKARLLLFTLLGQEPQNEDNY